MDILKELQTQAEQAEVVQLQSESTTVIYEANKLKTSKVEQTWGTAVRVVRKGRLGFAASSDGSSLSSQRNERTKATDKLITNALESASYGDAIPIVFPALKPAHSVTMYDSRIAEFPIPQLVSIGQEIVELLLGVSPEARINVTLNRGVNQIALRNQTGLDVSFSRSPLSIIAEVMDIQGDDILSLFDMLGTTVWDNDYLAFARRLSQKLALAKRLTPIRSGRMPVVFSPTGSLVLGLPLMEGLNGKNVFTGVSPLIGKVGEKLFDRKLTVVDDAGIDGKFGSAPYDDEGVAHRRNAFIQDGTLNGFYYDLKTATQSGLESTGNGSRSLFSAPRPDVTNLIIGPGETTLADILAGIDDGLLVEDVLGLGQGNILSGAFSNPLSLAFKIEKGEIVGRVKNASISGNVYELLKDVSAVSRESDWVYSNFSLPYILLPDMNVVAQD